MSLSLQELGREYEQAIIIQQKVIDENRKKLLQAQKSGNFNEIKRLSSLLKLLYDEKYELQDKAHKLRAYYT